MGIYREEFDTTDDGQEWKTWEVYEQPAWRHYLVKAVSTVTLHTGKLEVRLDPLLERLHELRCHDDCWTGEVSRIKPYWKTPEGRAERAKMKGWSTPQNHPEMWDTEVTTMCNRTPFPAAVDMWVYYLGQRKRRLIGTVDGPKQPFGTEEANETASQTGPKIGWTTFAQKRMRKR